MSIHESLSAPLYGGGGLSLEVPYRAPVALAGHLYHLDHSKTAWETLPAIRPSSDIGSESSEQSLDFGGLWRRTMKDWRNGAGQTYFDDTDQADRARFRKSKGVDALTTPRRLTLLHDTERKLAMAGTLLPMVTSGTYTIAGDGANVRRFANTDLVNLAPAHADVAMPNTVRDLAADGTSLYAAVEATIVQKVTLATFAATANLGTFVADYVGYGNGRLLATRANRVVELDAAGAFAGVGQLDYSHRNTGFMWRGIAATPNALYLWGDANGHSEVYVVTVDPDTSRLRAPVWAWTVPAGETVLCLAAHGGLVAIGTTLGFRLATQSSNLSLAAGSAIVVPGGVTDVAFWGDQAWFTWTNYDTVSTGLGRVSLARLTDADNLVPAWQSDLMVTGQGAVRAVVAVDGRPYFTVDGNGLWGQADELIPSGTLYSGWVNFSTIERKVATSVDMRFEPLRGSVMIGLAYDIDPDVALPYMLAAAVVPDSTAPTSAITTSGIGFEDVELVITLNRSSTDPLAGPALRRVTSRGRATPTRTDRITLALRIARKVEGGGAHGGTKEALIFEPLDEYSFLKSLEGAGTVVLLQAGRYTANVIIDAVKLLPTGPDEDGTFYNGILMAECLTLLPMA